MVQERTYPNPASRSEEDDLQEGIVASELRYSYQAMAGSLALPLIGQSGKWTQGARI